MSDFNWISQKGAKAQYKPKIDTAEFGGGYSQRTQTGINNNPQSWNGLRFIYNDEDETDKIEDFLELKGGRTAFTWTPPGKSEGKYICPEWSRDHISKGVTTITANFKQVFE